MMLSTILRTATRFMLPLLLQFSLFLLLRGHNEPGGGFAGGLVAAAAFVTILAGRQRDAIRGHGLQQEIHQRRLDGHGALRGELRRRGDAAVGGGEEDVRDDPTTPTTTVLPAEPDRAASTIADTFLPAYRRALHNRDVNTVLAALERIRDEHQALQAIKDSGRYTDGVPLSSRLIEGMASGGVKG